MLELKNIHKSFGDVQVLNRVDLTLEKIIHFLPFRVNQMGIGRTLAFS